MIPSRLWPTLRLLLLPLLLAILYLGFHAHAGLFDVDEAIFTQASREMHASGIYSMPSYNGVPRYQKPPLIYWLQNGTMQLLGEHNLWAARLPSAIFGLATVLLLGYGIWRFTGNRTWALWSTAAMGLNLSFLAMARLATADAVLNFFSLALALWTLRVLYLPAARGTWLVTALLVALGLLAKGPVAGIPAALITLPLLVARTDRWQLLARLHPLKVIVTTLLLLTPWLWLLHRDGMLTGFFTQFVLDENLHRFGPGLSNSQSGSPLYYLLVLALGFMPWVFFLPQAIVDARKNPRRRLTSNDIKLALPYLALVWAAGIIGLFMLSGTKLAHYIVPAYPALAIIVGAWAGGGPTGRKQPTTIPYLNLWVLVQVTLLALVFALLPSALEGLRATTLTGWLGWLQEFTGFAWPPHDILTYEVLRQPVAVNAPLFWLGAALLLAGTLTGYTLASHRHPAGLPVLAGGMAGFLLAVIVAVVPTIWAYTQAPLASLAEDIRATPPTTPVIHLGLHKPSALYLSDRPFLKLEKPLQLPAAIPPGGHALILTEQADVAAIGTEMGRIAQVEVTRCTGGYCLLTIRRE